MYGLCVCSLKVFLLIVYLCSAAHTLKAIRGAHLGVLELVETELPPSLVVFAHQFSNMTGKTNLSLKFHTPEHGYSDGKDPLELLRGYTPPLGTRVVACDADCFLSDAFARVLSLFAELEYIRFRFNDGSTRTKLEERVGDDGVKAIVESPMMHRLGTFEIVSGCVSDKGVEAIAKSPHMTNLRSLDLNNCISKVLKRRIGSIGLKALATSPYLRNIRKLGLAGGCIGDDGIAALAESALMDTLEELDLCSNKIGDKGAIAFANGRRPKALTVLLLSNKMIWKEPTVLLLTDLTRAGHAVPRGNMNKIGDVGAGAIICSPALPHLQKLSLKDTGVTAAVRGYAPVRSGKVTLVFDE